jgi:protein TonB
MLFRQQVKFIVLSCTLFIGVGWLLAFAQEKKDVPEGKVNIEESTHTKKAEIIHMVKPPYPVEAKKQGIEGLVRIDVTVNKQGEVIGTEVRSGPKELREAAVNAVRQWRYKPLDVEFKVTVDVNYELGKKKEASKS